MKVFDFSNTNGLLQSSPIAATTANLTQAANLRFNQTAVASGLRVADWARRLRDWWANVQFNVSSVILSVAIIIILLISGLHRLVLFRAGAP